MGQERDRRRREPEITYLVGLAPEQVIERLRALPDVQAYAPERMPDLGDVVPARRFMAQVEANGFRVCVGGRETMPGTVRGFDNGGGFFRRLYLSGRLRDVDGGTEVALRFSRLRSPRSSLRWFGLLATVGAALAWLFFGASGTFDGRLVLVSIFCAFTLPVVAYDLKQRWSLRAERLELYSLVEGLLGPEELGEGERSPYRRRLSAG